MASNSLKATLASLHSTKVPQEPILIIKAKNFSHASRGMFHDTRLYLATFASVTALIYQPPHPWVASDGPVPGRGKIMLHNLNLI